MERDNSSDKFPIGSKLPSFTLKNVDGEMVASEQFFRDATASLVVFTCNHCPYVKGSEDMLVEIVRRFQPQGLRAVTINSNDAMSYPEDSFEKMQEKAARMQLPYPYLYDETQQVAKQFDAACTPEVYLFDAQQKLVFHGTINDSPKDGQRVSKNYLAPAIERLLSGLKPEPAFVHPIGCSIKWRSAA